MDALQIHARRLNAKEVLMQKNGELFICPIADGPVKIVLARSGFPEIHLKIRITLHVEKSTTMFFEAESDGSPPSDTLTDDGEARNDFSGRSLGTVSVVITLNQELSSMCRRKNSQYHCETLTRSRKQILSWTCCWKAALTILGTLRRSKPG